MNSSINRKGQELCFALLRISAHIRRFELRRTIERLSYHLLENISYQNPEMTLSTIEAIRNFVVLGKNIYEIEPVNAKILERELERLGSDVRSLEGILDIPDLETMFSKSVEIKRSKPKTETNDSKEMPTNEEVKSGNPEVELLEDGSSEIRKEKIIQMISSSPEKRLPLKDIVSAFPEVSDRTIRYDLKKLFLEGGVVRQGSGGPSNYYTLK